MSPYTSQRSHFSDDSVRIRFVLALVLLLVAVTPGVAVSQTNFVVVITDDQRWDTEFAMTNVLNRIAAQGVRFTNTFSTIPVCGPTRAVFHSGGFAPDDTGIVANTFPNGGVVQFNDSQTVGTAFFQAGYKTLHLGKYVNNYHQDLEPYIPPGWTRWVHSTTIGSSTLDAGVGTTVSLNGVPRLEYYRDQALDFIDEFQASPFFIVLEAERPHWPSIPLAQEVGLYPDFLYRERAWLEEDLSDKPPIIQSKARDYPDWYEGSIAEEDEFHRDQLRSVHGVDRIIGDILDKLEERNLQDNTVVVFVSDHGYLWGEHGQFGKGMAYEESLRTPMAMRVPGVAPREDDRLVAWDMDLPATLFELAGIAAPTDGTSLLPALNDPLTPRKVELPSEHWDNQLTWAALRTIEPGGAQWKYVEWGTGPRELYDLINDPFELQNLEANPAFASVLADLEARRALHPRSLAIGMIGRDISRGAVGAAYSYDFPVWGGTPPSGTASAPRCHLDYRSTPTRDTSAAFRP